MSTVMMLSMPKGAATYRPACGAEAGPELMALTARRHDLAHRQPAVGLEVAHRAARAQAAEIVVDARHVARHHRLR